MVWNGTRKAKLFDPLSKDPFKVSRTKIDLFVECSRCFYLDRRLGVARPSMPAFTLNSAVDHLLKKEFDAHRAQGVPHPFMEQYKIDAIPFSDKRLDEWRENFVGVQALHEPSNFLVFGAVDDLWKNAKGEIHIVDYKSTAKDEAPTLEGRWQQAYKRQAEVYQWLVRHNGLTVSPIAYFVYVNGRRDAKAFDAKLEFSVEVIPYEGSDAWVEPTLLKMREALMEDALPPAGELCEHCAYREKAGTVLRELYEAKHSKSKKDEGPATLF